MGPQDEIPVQSIAETFIEVADLLPNAAAPEHRLLWDEIEPFDRHRVVLRQNPSADLHSVFVDADAMAVHDVDIGIVGKGLGDIGQCSRHQYIIAVEISHDVAVATDGTKSDIQSVGL